MTNGTADSASESVRLKDLQSTVDVLVEGQAKPRGARTRIAKRYGVQKPVITDRVKRIETFFGVKFFAGPQHNIPTAAGQLMARYGPKLIEEIEHLTAILQNANDRDTEPPRVCRRPFRLSYAAIAGSCMA